MYISNNSNRTYTAEQLKSRAQHSSSSHLSHHLKRHLIDLGIFYPREKIEKRRERYRRRRRMNKTNLPVVSTTNLRSINNKQDELLQFLIDSRTDIACLTETWIDEDNQHPISNEILELFHVISRPRHEKLGGGTLVAIKKEFASTCEEIVATNTQQDGSNSLEVTTVRIQPRRILRGFNTCIVSSVYIPPSNNQTVEMSSLCDHLSEIIDSSRGTPLIYTCGDFNKAKTNTIKSHLGLSQLNKAPTRKNNVLDLVLTNAPRCYQVRNRLPIGNADHQVITITPDKRHYNMIIKPNGDKKFVRKGKVADLVEEFNNTNWDIIIRSPLSLQDKVDIFYETATSIINTHQPLKRSKLRNDRPWMTEEIKELIPKRQKLYHQGNDEEWKALATRIKLMIRERKRAFYSQLTNKDPK